MKVRQVPLTSGQGLRRELGLVSIVALFIIQVYSDLTSAADSIVGKMQEGISPAYSAITVLAHSTTVIWLAMVTVGAVVFMVMWLRALREGRNLRRVFSTLP